MAAFEKHVAIGSEGDQRWPRFATRCLQVLGPANEGSGPYACRYDSCVLDVATQRFGEIRPSTHQDPISQKAIELGGDPNCGNWLTFASLKLLEEL